MDELVVKKAKKVDENTPIPKITEDNVFELFQLQTVADLRLMSRNFMRLSLFLDDIYNKLETKYVKNTDLATDTTAGIVTLNKIREVAPQPNLSPYVRFDKGYRVKDSTTEFVRTNNHTTWAGYVLEMYNGDNNQLMGKFHTNGGRAYYAVPNRNGGNWNEIMDNHDMAVRDGNIANAHNRITETWGKATDAWNKAHDAQVNRIYEIRLAGYIEEGINSKNERNGYVLTKVSRLYGQAQDSIRIGSRVLQFFRNGQWLNAYFA